MKSRKEVLPDLHYTDIYTYVLEIYLFASKIILSMKNVSTFNLMTLVLFVFATISTTQATKDINIMAMFPIGGGAWTGAKYCLEAVQMAVEDINNRTDILEDYHLVMHWRDTKCNAGLATNLMYEMLNEPPTKHMLLGAGCSPETQATAQASHLWNLTQISYGSSSPALSNRGRFPRFFRLISSDLTLNPTRVQLMKTFGWTKVATIHESNELFSDVTYDLLRRLSEQNISLLTAEIFKEDPTIQVQNLKRHDARIIVGGYYEDKARTILCQAYKLGMKGPSVIWILPGWYGRNWWRKIDSNFPCTIEEMEQAAEGHLLLAFFAVNPLEETGISGATTGQWVQAFLDRYGYSQEHSGDALGNCYDSVWALSLALNSTVQKMIAIGHPKTLDQFSYEDDDINDMITDSLYDVAFKGMRGDVAFLANGEGISTIKIEQVRGGERFTVGMHRKIDSSISWLGNGIVWKDGKVPRDSMVIIMMKEDLPRTLYVVIAILASCGIALSLVFLAVNVIFRKCRVIKLSSPRINNVILCGCALMYTTVLFEASDAQIKEIFCKVRTFVLTIGFSATFGGLFAKTWRVHRIFCNKHLKAVQSRTLIKRPSLHNISEHIKDHQLFIFVTLLLAIDVSVLVIWESLDSQRNFTNNSTSEVSSYDPDIVIQYQVDGCYSKYSIYFTAVLYGINGLLLAFGAFLSWETRKVKMANLNDSQYIGVSIYNVVVLSSVGVVVSYVIENKPALQYGLLSGFIIICVTLTQLLIFIPKVVALKHDRSRVDPVSGDTTATNTSGAGRGTGQTLASAAR